MFEEYAHFPLNEEIEYSTGYIWKSEETTMPYDDEEIIYFVGHTSAMGGCCAGWYPPHMYIMVPGYLRNWQCRTNDSGLPVSEIEPIRDEATRDGIIKFLREKYDIDEVVIW
ncbi:MAG: hypothetical protein R6U89_10285 [Dehalococcoidia bacterium]